MGDGITSVPFHLMPKKELIRPNLACGCDRASVCVCVNADFIASGWAWFHEPMLHHWGVRLGCGDR